MKPVLLKICHILTPGTEYFNHTISIVSALQNVERILYEANIPRISYFSMAYNRLHLNT